MATITSEVRIKVPVEYEAQAQSMRAIIKELEDAASQVDLTSGLGKKFTAMLKKMRQQVSEYETIALQPTIDKSGLNTAKKTLTDFKKYANQIGSELNYANIFDFKLSQDEINQINTFTDKIRELNRELTKIRKTGSDRSTEDFLTSIGQTDLLNQARTTSTRFRGSATFAANRQTINQEAAGAKDERARLQAEQARLQGEAANLANTQREIQNSLRAAEQQLRDTENIVNRGNFLSKFEALDSKILRTESGQNRGQTAVLNAFMKPFETGAIGGRLAQTNVEGARSILRYLGFDQNVITQLLQRQIPEIRAAIAQQLDIIDGSRDALTDEAYDRISSVRWNAHAYMRRHATPERYARLGSERQQVASLRSDLNRADREILSNQEAQTSIGGQLQEINTLITQLDSVSAALARFQQQLDQSEIDKLNDQIEEQNNLQQQLTTRIRKERANVITQPLSRAEAEPTTHLENTRIALEQEEASIRESQQFSENLRSSIKQWMSAQQIVNLIKQGVRQAWQDIQGLDKAMTNIAVVTDMSVSDLWGKINEYMSVAQQYGVTTQGVYEVSQLYYQQGLNANEVMAATTETLKMARQNPIYK